MTTELPMVDPGWGIWGKFPPHLVEEPYFLFKILNFVRPRSAYITHENMHILLAFITNSLETKVN